jgi:rSAM/selenodomain-associated transferase 2
MTADILPLSVVIPTLNAAAALPGCVAALAGRAAEIVVADGGSADSTPAMAARLDACVIATPRGRGTQLAAGANAATQPWLLFLHADTRLGAAWPETVAGFLARPDAAGRAGYFRLRFDSSARPARVLEAVVAQRSRWLGLPYGDQGLLIHRDLYGRIGGYPPVPLMEDVALVRRIGRRRLIALDCEALTSAARYERDGFLWRALRNTGCLTLYVLGVPPARIARLYG